MRPQSINQSINHLFENTGNDADNRIRCFIKICRGSIPNNQGAIPLVFLPCPCFLLPSPSPFPFPISLVVNAALQYGSSFYCRLDRRSARSTCYGSHSPNKFLIVLYGDSIVNGISCHHRGYTMSDLARAGP